MSVNGGIIRLRMARDSIEKVLDDFITATISGGPALHPGDAIFVSETAERNIREAILAFRDAIQPQEGERS